MGDKGSLPKSKPKGSLKSSVSANGKDSSSAKSKSGRKVQFDSEDSSEIRLNTSAKSDKPTGDSGKGGKGDKVSNGVKSPAAKQPLELNIEKELPKNAQCWMDCEAADTLQGIQEQMVILSEDPTIVLPAYFGKGLQYAKRNDHYKSPQAARLALEPLKKHGVSDGEICMIGNLCLESIDEVFALVPSLKGKKNKLKEPLTKALCELANCRNPTSMVEE